MLTQEKLAYLQEKLVVSQTLGDTDTATLWQDLIDELKERISVVPSQQVSPSDSILDQNQLGDDHDTEKAPMTTAAST
jgi:hypothetical protein